MANFKKFDDLHDFNRKMMEDDWNMNQHLVFKLKQSMNGIDLATTMKVGHAQPGESAVVKLEQKNKGVSTDFGGLTCELKASNDGKVKFQTDFTGLMKDIEGFENSALTADGEVSAAKGAKWNAGFEHNGKDHKFTINGTVQKDPTFVTQTVWRPCDWFVVGEKSDLNTSLTNTKSEIRSVANFQGSGIQCGSWLKATHEGGMKFGGISSGGNVAHTAGANTVAAQLDFDYTSMKAKTQIALQNKQDDHTWRFMAHSSGTARALLQWQMHRVCKATVNTCVDLGELPSGKMNPLTWGAGFEVKY